MEFILLGKMRKRMNLIYLVACLLNNNIKSAGREKA